jgi:hypothetical protein
LTLVVIERVISIDQSTIPILGRIVHEEQIRWIRLRPKIKDNLTGRRIITLPGTYMAHNRAIWTTPEVITGIDELNSVATRIYIDQVDARVNMKDDVMYFYARRSARLLDLDTIYIILDDTIIVGNGAIAG